MDWKRRSRRCWNAECECWFEWMKTADGGEQDLSVVVGISATFPKWTTEDGKAVDALAEIGCFGVAG